MTIKEELACSLLAISLEDRVTPSLADEIVRVVIQLLKWSEKK